MTIDEFDEEDFPRGGEARDIKKKRNFVFEKNNLNDPKIKKPGRRERKKLAATSKKIVNTVFIDESNESSKFSRFERLTYKGLSEGTVAFCCVRAIYNNYVDLSMPGRLGARLYIQNVSEPFNELLKEGSSTENEDAKLEKLFRVGQRLVCSVLSVISPGEEHQLVKVSSEPRLVNASLSFGSVGEGMILQMAVQSLEDHGYMMSSGITGLVTFLPMANATSYIKHINGGQPLSIGQILWCLVTRTKLTNTSNTIHVSLDTSRIEESKIVDDINMTKLLPGVRFDVTITKIVSQTLLATVDGTNIQGYIDDASLSTPWSRLSDYEIGSSQPATVLFKFPYPKQVALTLDSSLTRLTKEEIPLGTIFQDAEVNSISKRGVCLKLVYSGRTLKGMISARRLGDRMDVETMSTKFPVGNHITCRVIGFDALEQVYSCTTEDKILTEKFLWPSDLKIGDLIEATVDSVQNGGLAVTIGSVKGFVPSIHISDVLLHNPLDKVKLNSKLKGKVLQNDGKKKPIVTLRPTLVTKPALLDFASVSVGEAYYGFITKICPDEIIVSFFGSNYAHIKEQNLLLPPIKYTYGELVKCYVIRKEEGRLPVFSLLKPVQTKPLTVGTCHDLIVKEKSSLGLTCVFTLKGETFNGFLPASQLCDFPDFCETEMAKYTHGSTIREALLISLNDKLPLFSLQQAFFDFFKKNPEVNEGLNGIKEGLIIPCTVSEIYSDRLFVCAPIPMLNGKVSIKSEDLPSAPDTYKQHQTIHAKVTKKLVNNEGVTLRCHLNAENRQKILSKYLRRFLEYLYPLLTFHSGNIVQCLVKEINENSSRVSILPNKRKGFIIGQISSDVKVGKKLEAKVIFEDTTENIVYLYPNDGTILFAQQHDFKMKRSVFSGTYLCKIGDFFVVLADTGDTKSLAFVHKLKHLNSSEEIEMKDFSKFSTCNLVLRVFNKIYDKYPFYWLGDSLALGPPRAEPSPRKEVSEKTSEPAKKKKKTKRSEESSNIIKSTDEGRPKQKKRKLTNDEESEELSESTQSNKTDKRTRKRRVKEEQQPMIDVVSGDSLLEEAAGFVWDATVEDLAKALRSNDEANLSQTESEDEADSSKTTKKKLTAAERRAAAAERERQIRDKEQELLEADAKPQSAEHFDRLVTATPNNSKLWIMYMAHHMEATEIDKARSVAKRALKTINVRLEEERLNVWIASLNLENMYGTPASFKEVLTEALKYNDDYKVYQHVLDIYADSKKEHELENLVNVLVKKYRTQVDCWLKCQEALMKAGLPHKARNYLQKSLESLPHKDYCSLIARFALVENKFGFSEQAESLLENLLTSYPKRTDIWFVYVDMLTKSGSVELARNVLERATSQKLPLRKMKSLYQKWLKLEETFGTVERVQKVREAAEAYIANLTSALKNEEIEMREDS